MWMVDPVISSASFLDDPNTHIKVCIIPHQNVDTIGELRTLAFNSYILLLCLVSLEDLTKFQRFGTDFVLSTQVYGSLRVWCIYLPMTFRWVLIWLKIKTRLRRFFLFLNVPYHIICFQHCGNCLCELISGSFLLVPNVLVDVSMLMCLCYVLVVKPTFSKTMSFLFVKECLLYFHATPINFDCLGSYLFMS